MKRKTFLNLMIIAIAMIISLTACSKPPACEKNNTGEVKIYNNYSVTIIVDVWSNGLPGEGFAGERTLGVGKSTTYSGIPAGPIEIWEDDVYSEWGYWSEYCNQCETFEFEIYSGKGANTFINTGVIEQKVKSSRKF